MPVDSAYKKRVPYAGDLPGEEWRPVVGYEGIYEVSSLGRVRCIRITLLKPTKTDHGYLRVTLCGTDRRKINYDVQRLVCMTFHGSCPDGMECRHLNDVRDDNRMENLAWGTPKQNAEDRDRNGHGSRGTQIVQSKMTDEIVADARRRVANGETRTVVAKSLGVSITALSAAVAGDWWKHVPGAVPKKKLNERNARLSEGDIVAIRLRFDGGERASSIARSYPHVDRSTVDHAAHRRTWRHIP